MAMARILRILFVVLLIGPHLGEVTLSVMHKCAETRDCCGAGAGDGVCAQCPCCAERAPATVVAQVALPPVAPLTAASPQTVGLAPPPFSADILHVPKTTLA